MNSGATSERVHEALRRRIMENQFRPGERLDPTLLAEELMASTTPVREALNQLLGERLLETRLGVGFSVPLIDEPALKDSYAWSGQLLALSIRNWVRNTKADDNAARFDRARTLSERTASLFLSIARGSTNREHGTATHRLNMRLHAVRSAEAEVLGDLEHEISSIEMHFARREENALRKGLAAYHRTRQKSAADIVRALYRPA